MHGKGKYTLLKDRRWHEGKWDHGNLIEHGNLFWPKNSKYKKYDGEILNGMMNGIGVLTDKEGYEYKG